MSKKNMMKRCKPHAFRALPPHTRSHPQPPLSSPSPPPLSSPSPPPHSNDVGSAGCLSGPLVGTRSLDASSPNHIVL